MISRRGTAVFLVRWGLVAMILCGMRAGWTVVEICTYVSLFALASAWLVWWSRG